MIKLNVLYPGSRDTRFDHACYRDKHMPMVANRLGAACLYIHDREGLSGALGRHLESSA